MRCGRIEQEDEAMMMQTIYDGEPPSTRHSEGGLWKWWGGRQNL